MGRLVRVLLGPLPATVLLLPFLLAGGLGAVIGLVAGVVEPGRSAAERWATVTTTGTLLACVAAAAAGALSLWIVVLAEPRAGLRRARLRWWLVAGLVLGLLAAGGWLWTMASGWHSYRPLTWAVWLGLLVGPLVLGIYYLVRLLRQ